MKSKKITKLKNLDNEKIKLYINSNRKSNNKALSKKLDKNDKKIFENKKIIINDTKKYNASPEMGKVFKAKIKHMKLNKLNIKDISKDEMNYKYSGINTEANNPRPNIMNNTISDFKLNITKNIMKKTQKVIKPYLNDKDLKPIEKKKVSTNIIKNKNKNKKNNFGFGDSYEFNFTFNNYNNNFTQNNINNTELKKTNKKKNKIILENLADKTIINGFTSMRNNILKDIKDIIINKNKNNKEDVKKDLKQENKIGKIGVIRKNKKKNNDIYAIKIQKIFRGYIFRKNNKLIHRKKPNERINSNFGVYIRKKILNKKYGLNLNFNDNIITNYQKEYNLTEMNLTQPKLTENNNYNINNNVTQENKIEEIIIDKNKLINVLGPSTKRKEQNEQIINSGYKFGLY